MKKILLLSFYLFAALSLILSGCHKEESEEPETNPSASMSAKIDDVDWSATQAGCSISNGIAGIVGTAPQSQTIILTLSEFSEGIIPLEFNGTSVGAVTDGNVTYTTNSDPQTSGIVIITYINNADSLVSGTFEFYAYSPFGNGFVSVSDGNFTNVPFTNELPPIPDNSLVVDIDGSTFTPATVNASLLMGKIMISASNAQVTKTIGISIEENLTDGTYDIGGMFGSVSGQYNIGTSVIMIANEGELVITKHDMNNNILEGTFEFEAAELIGTNSASLTNGNFVVNY
ncbi:MAG: hypothetical protein K8R74_08950 [Bacteroidales bacterium]|nr:hypothetical protein [Bacteroidales bacterium]